IVAEAGGSWPVLAGAVVWAEGFVPVDVEYRDDHEDHAIQPGGVLLTHHHVAYQHEGGIFALDLASVNSALDEHHYFAGFSRGLGCEGAILGHHECDHAADRKSTRLNSS